MNTANSATIPENNSKQAKVTQALVAKFNQKIHNNDVEIPMLSEVASKVIRLTQDSESGAEDLARLIQSDQTLAAHVMRIANSANYSPNASLVSLQQAIARLGMRVIADIALAASINSKIFSAPGYGDFIAQQLKFSLYCGVWAKEIARTCRRNVEAAFLAGLLHDIGRPVAIHIVINYLQEKNLQIPRPEFLNIVTQLGGTLNGFVARRWELPNIVCEIVEHFHDYNDAGKAREQTMIVVAGALFAAQFSGIEGREAQAQEDFLANAVFADLNLYPDDIAALSEKMDLIKQTVEAMSL